MRFTRRQTLPALAGLLAVALALTARGLAPDFFERAQLFVFDSLQRAKPWEITRPQVRVIDIDDASLKRVGQWPWSRSILAKLVVALQDMQAKSIAFDMVFAEPDRTSPARLVAEWRQSFPGRLPSGPESSLPDYDSELAAAFARGRVVTGFGLLAEANGAAPTIDASVATIGGDPSLTVQNFAGAVPNLNVLETAAAGNGSLSIAAGRDQVVRALPLLAAFDGKLVPALSLEALRVAADEDTIGVRAERNGGAAGAITGYTARVGAYQTPVNVDGSLLLHHGAPPAGATISAWRLLDPNARANLASEISGRIALIGTSAVGLSDLRATPLNPLEPGVALHARAIEQMLSRHFLTRPAWAPGAEWVAAAALALALIALVSLASLQTAALATGLSAILLVAATWLAFSLKGLLLDPSLIAIVAIPGALAASFARYFVAEREAWKLRAAFTHYLSPALVEALARDPDGLKLGGEQREMTFLFTDLESFTSLIEGADAPDIVTWLNDYLDGLCRIAMDHGGTVDKIVGDAVHVMFNAPLDQPDHAERAVRCAIAIDEFAQQYRAALRQRGVPFGATRIGVNTGSAVVGNFGGGRRFDYTAHGDAINTAARLEAANKALGTRICVARATIEQVATVAFLPVGTLTLKGKTQGVDVFAPADADLWAADYLDAFARVARGDESGSTALLVLAERYPDHPILALHARRIRAGERSLRMAA